MTVNVRVGTRASALSRIQTHDALQRMEAICPQLQFEMIPFQSPGDRDKQADLRASAADFFTRDLDRAVLNGEIDCAVHSAKDVPDPIPEGLDWFWLPWRADRRDALILREEETAAMLPEKPRIGVSSNRRELYARQRFPLTELVPLRGTIEERLAQLDDGSFDAILMAGCALQRLGLGTRITEWISLDALDTPVAQGALAVTFRADHDQGIRLRSLFVRSVVLAGAGAGSAETCTQAVRDALARCDVCLYDALLDDAVLDVMPATAERLYVGKRSGQHSAAQRDIVGQLQDLCRQGLRVVRLKGGDPGVFGRLAEEVDGLEALSLPYRVLPGISSLAMATTGTGMLLTRRGLSRGFTVMTPREAGGGVGGIDADARAQLPLVFFMGISVADQIAKQLLDDGRDPATPAAFVFNAGADDERIVCTTLKTMATQEGTPTSDTQPTSPAPPGLLIVGDVTQHLYKRELGGLRGARVLVTGSGAIRQRTCDAIHDLGGQPVCRPLVRMVIYRDAIEAIGHVSDFAWLVVTSPSAVRCLGQLLQEQQIDMRTLPRVMSCGPGTSRELRKLGIHADAQPQRNFSSEGLVDVAGQIIKGGERILRLRSDRAGQGLADALGALGASVDDCVLYENQAIIYDTPLPECDAVFLASASAVDAFMDSWGIAPLKGMTILGMGTPTTLALERYGLEPHVVGPEATIESGILALAVHRNFV